MAFDRVFSTPTITVDQDKYDDLIKTKTLYLLKLKEEKEYKKMEEMKSLKIMISQPMDGKSEEQIRNERAKLVKELAKSIEAMSKVDAVTFMPGWENARGCKIEHEIAVKYYKFIKEVEEK